MVEIRRAPRESAAMGSTGTSTRWPASMAALSARQYAGEWTGTKARWNLAVDAVEKAALLRLAAECPGTTVTYEPAV